MDIIQYITKELYKKQEVAIPGFGKFTGKRENAKFENDEIHPPRQKVEFIYDTKSFALDLAMTVANKENITEDEAATAINNFVLEAEAALKENKQFELAGLGIIYVDAADKIVFTQANDTGLLADTFGMNAIPVVNINNTGANEAPALIEAPSHKSLIVWWIGGVAAICLLIFGLWWFFMDGQQMSDTYFAQTDADKQKTEQTPVDNTKQEPVTEPVTTIEPKPDSTNASLPEEQTAKNDLPIKLNNPPAAQNPESKPEKPATKLAANKIEIYLIVGSYKARKNAQERADALSKVGFASEVIDGQNGYFRVSIGKFTNSNDATKVAEKFTKAYPKQEVWAL